MADLNSILNIAIPIGIVLFFIGMIYIKIKEPIDALGHWIKSLFQGAAEKTQEMNMPSLPSRIVYDRF
jgi:hypothetical protein